MNRRIAAACASCSHARRRTPTSAAEKSSWFWPARRSRLRRRGRADGHGGALDRVLKLLLAELPLKQAARLAAQITETRDNEAYKRALQLKQ